MAELILRNREGQELWRVPLAPLERFDIYGQCQRGEPLVVQGRQYRIETLAWRKPENELVCCVSWVGWAPTPSREE